MLAKILCIAGVRSNNLVSITPSMNYKFPFEQICRKATANARTLLIQAMAKC